MKRRGRHSVRRGTVLLVVMVITAMAAMAAASLMFRVQAEVTAASAGAGSEQAYAAAMSGVKRVIYLLQSSPDETGGWIDNPDYLRNQLVWDDGGVRWYFTVYAYNAAEPDELRYGVTDEAGKVNINLADLGTLMGLPGMTEELADCLMDFRDPDSNPRTNGAEQDYYDQLTFPYQIKNSPFVTLEELLLVKGFNGTIVYGEDANFNGTLDPNEDDSDETFPSDDSDGELNQGLRGSATVVSYEMNVDSDGKARLNINGGTSDLAKLNSLGLGKKTVEFIQVYRAEGQRFTHPSQLLGMSYTSNGEAGKRYSALKHIKKGEKLTSGVGRNNLATVMDKLTTAASRGRSTPAYGLINVNSAPRVVLQSLVGADDELAGRIMDARMSLDEETKESVAWLYTEDIVDAATFKKMAPALTARGWQYRIQCVGFGVPCGRFRVIEVVVDLAKGTPRIMYLRDITRLGLPMAMDVEDMEL